MGFKEQLSTSILEFTRETSSGGGAIAVLSIPGVTAGRLRLIPAAHVCCWNKGVGLSVGFSKLAVPIFTPSRLTRNEVLMGVDVQKSTRLDRHHEIRLTLVTVINWTVVYPICHHLGLSSAACRAKLRQGVFQFVFLDAFRQIFGQLYFGYLALSDSLLSLFLEFKNFQLLLLVETLRLKLKLLLLFLECLKSVSMKTFIF